MFQDTLLFRGQEEEDGLANETEKERANEVEGKSGYRSEERISRKRVSTVSSVAEESRKVGTEN